MPYLLERDNDDDNGEPSSDDTGKNVGIVIGSIVAIAILVPIAVLLRDCLRRLRNRTRHHRGEGGNAPVNHLNPAELMRLSSWRARQRDIEAVGKEELDLHHDELKTIAPELLYRNLSFASIKEVQHTNSAIKFPPPIVVRPLSPTGSDDGTDHAYTPRVDGRTKDLNPRLGHSTLASSDTKPVCSICLEEYAQEDLVRQTRCGHVFHSGCLALWLDGYGARCPLCQVWLKQPQDDT